MQKEKKRRRGQGKGQQFERDVCRKLSLWVSRGESRNLFWRSSQSGGRATTLRRKGENLSVHAGDIAAIDPTGHDFCDAFFIETKAYRSLNLDLLVYPDIKGLLLPMWDKVCAQSEQYNKIPVLITKENFKPCLIGLPAFFRVGVPLGIFPPFDLSFYLLDDFVNLCPKELIDRASLFNKILKRVEKRDDGCWLWTGAKDSCGYGSIWDGRRVCRANRIMYQVTMGLIPEGLCVCHTCDVPTCVNPYHLFLGTPRENAEDRNRKGRSRGPCGDKHRTRLYPEKTPCGKDFKSSKLTDNAVRDILARYSPRKVTFAMLAAEYGVSAGLVSHVVHKRAWKHIDTQGGENACHIHGRLASDRPKRGRVSLQGI